MSSSPDDYSKLDQPEVLGYIFHPRPDSEKASPVPNSVDIGIPVDEGIRLHSRFHLAAKEEPNILFFHGNGEIVSDYDSLGPFYTKNGLNFLAVDYRGYGRSTGSPTVASMLEDTHRILIAVKDWLATAERTGPLFVMGRSLGSAAALELVSSYPDDFAGLIIESGFATTLPLLATLGLDAAAMGISENDGFRNVRKISSFTKPTLFIHGQNDEIIPLNAAAILQAQSPARIKELQVVPGATHNTILTCAGEIYFEVIKRFTNKTLGIKETRKKKQN